MAEHDDYPADEFDDLAPAAKKGAHRRPSGPLSQGAAIALVTVLAIVAIILVGGTINIIKRSSSNPEAQDDTQIEATATAKPSASASAGSSQSPSESAGPVDRDKFDVHVLNASGKNGAAASMQSQLENKGWNVTDKSNASSPSKTTTIYYREKANKPAAEALAKDVGADPSDIRMSNQYNVDLAVLLCSDLA